MNLKARIAAALKGFAYPSEGGTSGMVRGWDAYGTNFIQNLNILRDDLTSAILATDPLQNSVVMSCLSWKTDVWPEAPLTVYREDNKGTQTAEPRPSMNPGIRRFQEIIRRPNEDYGDAVLWAGTTLSLDLDGNAYWQKLRGANNDVVGYMYLPHHLIEPWWPKSANVYIDHYNYFAKPGQPEPIPVEDIVHFRNGIDPKNTRKGISRLKSAMREIFTDDEGSNYTAAILWKMGVIGGIISPDPKMFQIDPDFTVSKEQLEGIKDKTERASRGQNRGGIVAHGLSVKYQEIGADPSQMNARELRKTPEERICALMGVSASVAGMGAGLDKNTFSNAAIQEEQSYRRGVIPLQRVIKDTLEQQTLRDFTDNPAYVLGFDTRAVRSLQEDQDAKAKRLNALWESDGITRYQLLSGMGMPADENVDNVRRSEWLKSIGVDPSNLITPVKPPKEGA
jgi:phage portal protein BeeE